MPEGRKILSQRHTPLDALYRVAAAPPTDGVQHLPAPRRTPRSGPRALHERTILREEKVVLGLVDQVAAALVAPDQNVAAHLLDEELGAEQRQTHVLEDL